MAHALQKSALDVLRCGQGSSDVRTPCRGGGRAAIVSSGLRNVGGVQVRAPAGGFGKLAWSGVSLVRRSAVVCGGGDEAENGVRGGAMVVTSVLAERGESSTVVDKEAEEPKKLEKEAVVMKSAAPAAVEGGFDVDPRVEEALKTQGFRSLRRTKLVATIGPACCSLEQLEALAASGMTVARLNMCHGTHDWHRQAIRNCRRLNSEKGYSIVVMIDTEGSEIHMGDLGGAASAKAEPPAGNLLGAIFDLCSKWWPKDKEESEASQVQDGDEWYFTVRKFDGPVPAYTLLVNYEGFAEDVKVGDELVVDGGMVRFEVVEKVGPDVKCKCIDPGLLLPCANLTFWRNGHIVQEKNVMLPTISSKDWVDIDFAISEGVDAIAVSFVKSPEVIKHLKSYVAARSPERGVAVFAKIEAAESLKCLDDIIRVSDGAMVARGDLGAQIPLEQVPSVQESIIAACRRLNKPVIVASQLLESMIEYPTPTRAEVADVSEAVRQQADALMLSGESAMGLFPQKAMEVLRVVSLRMEDWCREEGHKETVPFDEISSSTTGRISEQICNSAAQMASKLGADAIFVYTRRGYMASLLSRNRPDCPIFAFTEEQSVRLRMDLKWGVIPFRMDFGEDLESNLQRTFALMKARGMVQSGNLVVAVSDVLSPLQSGEILQSIQVRKIP